MLKSLYLAAALVLFALPAHSETWVKVKSPNFTVLSDGSLKDARDVALGFEQMRGVFSVALPGLRTDSSAETIVVAVKDRKALNDFLPPMKKEPADFGGAYLKGWEKDYAIVLLDHPQETREIAYHEYVHKLLHLNFTRMSTWLDEGLAEFFGNTELNPKDAMIGMISPRIRLLQNRTPISLDTLLSVTPASPYYRDDQKNQMFYAESWALTHFLMFGNNMGNGQRMNSYLGLLQKGVDRQAAFEQAFGNQDEIEKQFFQYFHLFSFRALRIDQPVKIDPSRLSGAAMSPAETDANLGSFLAKVGETDLAMPLISSALAADPQPALAHETAAFLHFRNGEDEEAQKEFDETLKLDPQNYLALYYRSMMADYAKTDPQSLAQLDEQLQKVIQLNPRFAPALVARSQIYVRLGRLQDAYNIAIQGQRLEPDRAGYATNAAAILLLGQNYPEAIKLGNRTAARFTTSDSAEALAVVHEARRLGHVEATADERALEAQLMKYADGTVAVEGVVKSTTCEKSKPLALALQLGDKTLNFVADKQYGVGFSDTLWYGEDHFSTCHHLEGMHAVVRYKNGSGNSATPASDPAPPTPFNWLELRDVLIPVAPPAK